VLKPLILLWFLAAPASAGEQADEQAVDCSVVSQPDEQWDPFLDAVEPEREDPNGHHRPPAKREPWRGALRELDAGDDARAP
jgi:hypothetical protein